MKSWNPMFICSCALWGFSKVSFVDFLWFYCYMNSVWFGFLADCLDLLPYYVRASFFVHVLVLF